MKHYQALCINKQCNGIDVNGNICEHSVPHGIGEDCYSLCFKMCTFKNCALIEVTSSNKSYKVIKTLGEEL